MRFIEIPSWSTVTLIEALWLGSGLIAMSFALLRIRPLRDDVRNAIILGEHDLCVIAKGYFRRELIRIGQATCVIGIGIYAATEPSPVSGPARTTLTGLIITAVLILISGLVSLQSFLDWRDRENIKRILEVQL